MRAGDKYSNTTEHQREDCHNQPYNDGAIFKVLKVAAPNGIDVYFDNVGGNILEACIAQINQRGLITCLRRDLAI